MSIRVKLYLSYMLMVFVPIVLMYSFLTLFVHFDAIEEIKGYRAIEQEEKFKQAMLFGEISYVLDHDSGKLESLTYLHQIQQRLGDLWTGLLITKDDEIINIPPFLSNMAPNYDWQSLIRDLPRKVPFHLFEFEISSFDFAFPDGASGKVIMLRRSNVITAYGDVAWVWVGLFFVCVVSLLLTYIVSRTIIRPIQALTKAAQQIKDGHLATPVNVEASGEIAELGTAFEEMRLRLKQSIDQSLQYEENRKLLLSHISHDLKTPISAIKGYVEGIMDGIANTDEKRQKYMGTIYRKATDMDQLIDELFLFSKLDMHKVAYHFETIDFHRYFSHLLEDLSLDLDKHGVQLKYEPQEDERLFVLADADKLSRVFTNILDNCVKYIGQERALAENGNVQEDFPLISIDTYAKGDQLVVSVEDNGPGISVEEMPHIFDGFYRGDQARSMASGGSGLGLAIVKYIIEGHGGSVCAETASSGGAKFILVLPLIKEGDKRGAVN